jgi:hypothetical protein
VSATATRSGAAASTPEREPDRCTQCGAPLAPDQEWCLRCGSSRTLIYPPPDWRIPVAVVAVVILLALAGFVFAIDRLSSSSSPRPSTPGVSSSSKRATVTPAAGSTTTSPSTASGASTGSAVNGIASWPLGLAGWTVAIESFPSETEAYGRARHVVAAYHLPVGVLSTSDHPAMTPGSWVLFYGRFTTHAGASAATRRLVARGYSTAQPEQVAPAGGI